MTYQQNSQDGPKIKYLLHRKFPKRHEKTQSIKSARNFCNKNSPGYDEYTCGDLVLADTYRCRRKEDLQMKTQMQMGIDVTTEQYNQATGT
jgi:hypothetical protein